MLQPVPFYAPFGDKPPPLHIWVLASQLRFATQAAYAR